MSDQQVVNNAYRPDLFYSVFVSCLFAPLVVLYAHGLALVEWLAGFIKFIPYYSDINELFGIGFGLVLLFGMKLAKKYAHNDFIAGPIETLSLYAFFFYGMLKGGIKLALVFTIAYIYLEVFGENSISANEREVAEGWGVTLWQYRLYQYLFSPLHSIVAMSGAYFILRQLSLLPAFSFNMSLAQQIAGLTVFLAVWKALEMILTALYNRTLPFSTWQGIPFSLVMFLTSSQLTAAYSASWVIYGLFVLVGWAMIIATNIESAQKEKILAAWNQRLETHIPTADEIAAVVAAVEDACQKGITHHKSNLYFHFPLDWQPFKLGKEGYILRTSGLGINCGFEIMAVEQEPKFADTSFPGMLRNITDVGKHAGYKIEGARERQIAGVPGVEFLCVDKRGHQMAAFFWCYQHGDFSIRVDAPTDEHLRLIRPVIEAFLSGCEMRG